MLIRFCILVILSLTLINLHAQLSTKINGVSLESPPKATSEEDFTPIAMIGANWVSVIPYGFSRKDQPEVFYNSERQWWGEREEGVEALVNAAHAKGLNVMLKPQVWIFRSWVGDFRCETEEDWKIWEETYGAYIKFYAQMAERLGVELYCLGTEYKQVVIERPEFWINLISDIRKTYSGQLTYAANWDEFEQVPFWADLDFIGVNAYFPLSHESYPITAELISAWKDPKLRMKAISNKYKIPLILTEYGYRSVDMAAGNQWETVHNSPNDEAQKKAYLALFETLWTESWIQGGFFWKWEFHQDHNSDLNNRYTPQGKSALSVIKSVYSNW